jgi:hypothetical protein
MYKEEDKNLIDTLCIKSIENILDYFVGTF